jgi:hypothetical protein
MARARRPSDDVHNARRRVRRQADRIERIGDLATANKLRDVARAGSGATIEQLDNLYRQYKPAKAQQQTEQQTVRQPRKKRQSDEIYNARRRLQRQADSLERQALKQPEGIREQMESFAKSLRKHADSAYGLKSQKDRDEALQRLGKVRELTKGASYGKSGVYRRNLIIQQQLNAAGTKDADSSITQRQKDVFWIAVKGLWPEGVDVPRNERYERVIDHFYFFENSDSKDFEKWLKKKKGLDIEDVAGDLSYVFEFITTELNDPADYESPEVPYDVYKMGILTLR